MLTLTLDDREVAVLKEYLRMDVSDLSVEIADTDRKDYRDQIKEKREALRNILDRLERIE